jgi:hypothetical protein
MRCLGFHFMTSGPELHFAGLKNYILWAKGNQEVPNVQIWRNVCRAVGLWRSATLLYLLPPLLFDIVKVLPFFV